MSINKCLPILLFFCIIFSLSSCKSNGSDTGRLTQNTVNEDSIIIDSVDCIESPEYTEIPNPNILTADSTRFYYMISGLFDDRDSIRKEFPLVQKHKWSALTYVVDERKFYLKPVELDTVYWHDDCNGIDMLTIQSISENKPEASPEEPNEVQYIYLTGLDRPLGEIPSHFHTQITVNPENPYTFKFNNIQYTLRAEGEYTENESSCNAITKNYMGRLQNYMNGCNNYKLYLESGGVVQLLNSGTYEFTCLEIYFIGDLDGDGKPDFLFETNGWYEGSEVTLFLSSKAEKGELVKNMGTSGNYYSC